LVKKSTYLFLFLLIGITAIAQPKTKRPNVNILKTNPLLLLWGSMPFTSETRLMYEFELGKTETLMLSFSYYRTTPFLRWNEEPKGTANENWYIGGFRFQVMKKYYFGKHATTAQGKYTGFLFSHHDVKYAPYRLHLKGTDFRIVSTSLCWVVGKQRKWLNAVTYDMYCGIGYKNSNLNINYWNGKKTSYSFDNEIDRIILSHLKVCAGFNIGYSF
jgi:hypothetical protein